MVRAGVVKHPVEWAHSGYREIQNHPEQYTVIDPKALTALCGFADLEHFQRAHRQWTHQALESRRKLRDDRWSEAIAIGSLAFVEQIKAVHRRFEPLGEAYALREWSEAYTCEFSGENDSLRLENTLSLGSKSCNC